jgi:hypothetical protein
MRAFRSRHIAQITSRARDFAVLAGSPTKAESDASQDGSDAKGRLQVSGRSVAAPNLSATLNHKAVDQRHSTSRCSAVSRLRIHRGQKYEFGHRLARRRSAVRTRFWTKSHASSLHLAGAQACQIVGISGERVDPRNCIL